MEDSRDPFDSYPQNLAQVRARFPEQFQSQEDGDYYWPDGWQTLVVTVCELVQTRGVQVRWSCIKEKLGQLQLIFDSPWERSPETDEIQRAEIEAFERSKEICACCSRQIPSSYPQPQDLHGWLISICPICAPDVATWHITRIRETLAQLTSLRQ